MFVINEFIFAKLSLIIFGENTCDLREISLVRRLSKGEKFLRKK